MPEINRYEMALILKHLTAAQVAAAKDNPSTFETTAQWNLRMAHERLLDLVLVDVVAAPLELAA